MKKGRSYSFTLIEVILSFILIGMIASGIYWLYVSISVSSINLEKTVQKKRQKLINIRKIRYYLMSTLTTQNSFQGKGAAKPFCMTEGDNGGRDFKIYLTLNNGVDPIPALSNEVLAKFYINDEGDFTVTITSHPVRKDIYTQVEADISLWKGVDSIFWEFTAWPPINKPVQSIDLENQDDIAFPYKKWVTQWKSEWMYEPPSVFRLTIRESSHNRLDSNPIVLTAVIPSQIQPLKLRVLE